jgi:hypothetical protein
LQTVQAMATAQVAAAAAAVQAAAEHAELHAGYNAEGIRGAGDVYGSWEDAGGSEDVTG